MKNDQQLFRDDVNLNKLLEQMLQQGPDQFNLSTGQRSSDKPNQNHPGAAAWATNPYNAALAEGYSQYKQSDTNAGDLGKDYAAGGFYNPKLYMDAYKGFTGGNGAHHAAIKARQAYMRAVGESNARSRKEYEQRIQQVKQAIVQRGMRDRVNQSFNSPQLQDVYNQIEKSISDNSLAGVTQQYSDLLKNQSFQTAGQGLTGSSIHAERLGDLQQGQNAAAINAQNQAHQYTQGLKQQNEQQRQQLVNTVAQQNPADSARFNSQIDAIVNQTRQLGQQYQNQAAGAQINQYGQNMQSQAIGGLLSGAGNAYSGYRQGYDNTMQQNQQQTLLTQLQQGYR